MFVNQTGLGQVRPIRIPPGMRVIRIPQMIRGLGQTCGPDEVLTLVAGMNSPTCVPTLQALQQQTVTEETSPFETAAAIANENAVAAAGLPSDLPSDWTSLTNAQQTALTYCGDYPSAPGCAGMTTAQILAANVGPNVAGNVPLNATPAQISTLTQPVGPSNGTGPTAQLANVSRPGQNFQVGDSWKLTITGTPNSPVSDSASQNGQSLGTSSYGSTNANGNFSLTGTFANGTVGSWSEQWDVGGVAAPVLSFTISAVPAAGSSSSSGSSSSTSSSSGASTTTSVPTGCFAPLAALGIPDPCLGPIGLIELGIIGVVLIAVLSGGKR